MRDERKLLNIVVYRRADETIYRFYQNVDGTFARVSTDVRGASTHLNFLSPSEVFQQLANAASLGYCVRDLRAYYDNGGKRLRESIFEGGIVK